MQARHVPIDGEAGVGYMMRSGYDLPPLMFSTEEIEAITVGLELIRRTGDISLEDAARRVLEKIASILPEPERAILEQHGLYASGYGARPPSDISLRQIRGAIREERKIFLHYCDEHGELTQRTIVPVALVYYIEVTILAAWCELRRDFRHFRVDRMHDCRLLDEYFPGRGEDLRALWSKTQIIP